MLYKLSQVNQALEALDFKEIPKCKVYDKEYVEN